MGVAAISEPKTEAEIAQLSINTIRTLCMDAVQQANSGRDTHGDGASGL